MDKQNVLALFAHLEHGDGTKFFEHVADDVDWTVEGSHPLAGRYRSKQEFLAGTFDKLAKVLPEGAQLSTENILIDGDWAIVELRSADQHAGHEGRLRKDFRGRIQRLARVEEAS